MDSAASESVVLEDFDEFSKFLQQHREDVAKGRYDLRIEKDWIRNIEDQDLLLLAKQCPSSRLTLAAGAKTAEVLQLLAGDSSTDVRETVGDNPRTPVTSLETLAQDHASSVRMAAAGNPNTPINILEKLAGDSVNYVRWSVANNHRTPPATLKHLAKDQDSHVRGQAKENPNTPRAGFFARLMGRG